MNEKAKNTFEMIWRNFERNLICVYYTLFDTINTTSLTLFLQ